MSKFKKAERKQVKLKLGISGPSGSGKTFSALLVAKGLLKNKPNAKIALIDTENKSASLYADTKNMPSFDTLEIEPPYTVDKYIEAMEAAIKEKYDLLIIDSVSHVWSGEGGLLQEKEALDTRGGNSFANWAKMTPKWNKFVSNILHSDIHMICTMRSKQEHAISYNDKGKTEVKKMGLAPQVRDGFEFELTCVFDMDMSHQAQASKDRTNLFDGRTWKPDEKTGIEISKWLDSGAVVKASEPAVTKHEDSPQAVTESQGKGVENSNAVPESNPVLPNPSWKATPQHLQEVLSFVDNAEKNKGKWTRESVNQLMQLKYKKTKLSQFTEAEYKELVTVITTMNSFDVLNELKETKEQMFEDYQ